MRVSKAAMQEEGRKLDKKAGIMTPKGAAKGSTKSTKNTKGKKNQVTAPPSVDPKWNQSFIVLQCPSTTPYMKTNTKAKNAVMVQLLLDIKSFLESWTAYSPGTRFISTRPTLGQKDRR